MRESSVNNILSKAGGLYAGPRGFTLVEMLIAMAVGMVVLGAMYGVFNIQSKTLGNQEEIVAMQQSVRAGMGMMAREIGMAGYDPCNVNSDSDSSNNFSGVTVNSTQLQIKADLDGNDPPGNNCLSPFRGIDASSQENIIYAIASDATTANPNNKKITRNIGAGAQSFVENVDAFTFEYLKSDGTPATASADVRQIKITITGRTAKPDSSYSANGGYRPYTLTSVIAPRNLAF
ncbi:MAG: prepilin-type N-terminal cleavage/methylation domain-containing protein [Syntrophales bacterium]|nr:prepilin-type N-terminal cleavage/methylation domain-containing protein [Syntrophales bacterium]